MGRKLGGVLCLFWGQLGPHLTQSGRQPNFVVWYNEWNYGTFAEGAGYI